MNQTFLKFSVLTLSSLLLWGLSVIADIYTSRPRENFDHQAREQSIPQEIQRLQAEIAAHPYDVKGRMNLARLLLASGGLEGDASNVMEGVRVLREVIDLEPKNKEALLLLAQTSFSFGVFSKAVTYYEQLLAQDQSDMESKFAYALSLIAEQRIDEAKDLLVGILARKPDDKPAQTALSLAEGTPEGYEKAKKLLAELSSNAAPRSRDAEIFLRYLSVVHKEQPSVQ